MFDNKRKGENSIMMSKTIAAVGHQLEVNKKRCAKDLEKYKTSLSKHYNEHWKPEDLTEKEFSKYKKLESALKKAEDACNDFENYTW